MQQSAFVAHCPYEIGDKLEIKIMNNVGLINYPKKHEMAAVVITDIITVHSLKNKSVVFMYEINGVKTITIDDWKRLNQEK